MDHATTDNNMSTCVVGGDGNLDFRRRMVMDRFRRYNDKYSGTSVADHWKSLPSDLQTDKKLVLFVLEYSAVLPHKTDFERKFPQWLRFDRDCVLAFANRSDFRFLYEERRLYVPEHLKGDKDVMLAYCRSIPRSLQDCSEALVDDRDIVRAAVQLSGLELQYASSRLREDEEIVRLACQNNGCALEYCRIGSDTRAKLTSDRDFMLDTVLQTLPDGGRMLKYATPEFLHDRELLLEALAHGMPFRSCPQDLVTSPEFLVAAMLRKSQLYLDLKPLKLQTITEVAIAAIVSSSSTPDVHSRALELCPSIRSRRDVALAIAKRGDKTFVKDFFLSNLDDDTTSVNSNNSNNSNNSTNVSSNNNNLHQNHNHTTQNDHTEHRRNDFLSDKEIMYEAIQRDATLFKYCRLHLLSDPDIISVAMTPESASEILRRIPVTLRKEHPKIMERAISISDLSELRIIRHLIPDSVWQTNRLIAKAWIRRGLPITMFNSDLIQLIQSERELSLEVAEHNPYAFTDVVRIELRSDVNFMTEAIDKNGLIIRFAGCPEILHSMPLIVRAIAVHPQAVIFPISWNSTLFPAITKDQVLQYIDERLGAHEAFLEFLRGIVSSTSSPKQQRTPHNVHNSHSSHLPMLDHGIETGQAFKKLIAEFVGIPVGPELKRVRIARTNLMNVNRRPQDSPSPLSREEDRNNEDNDHNRQLALNRRRLRRNILHADQRNLLLAPAPMHVQINNNQNAVDGDPIRLTERLQPDRRTRRHLLLMARRQNRQADIRDLDARIMLQRQPHQQDDQEIQFLMRGILGGRLLHPDRFDDHANHLENVLMANAEAAGAEIENEDWDFEDHMDLLV